MEAFDNTDIQNLKVALLKIGVTCVYHITNEKNLQSIQEKGLMPCSALDAAGFSYKPGSDRIDRAISKQKGLNGYVALSLSSSPEFLDVYMRSGFFEGTPVLIEIALEVLDNYDFIYYKDNPLNESAEPISLNEIDKNLSSSGLFYIKAAISKAFFISATRLEISKTDGTLTSKKRRRLLGRNGVKISSYYYVLVLAILACFSCAVLYHYYKKADVVSHLYANLLEENARIKEQYEESLMKDGAILLNILHPDSLRTVPVLPFINTIASIISSESTMVWNLFDNYVGLQHDSSLVFSSPDYLKVYNGWFTFKDKSFASGEYIYSNPIPGQVILRGTEERPYTIEIVQEYTGKKRQIFSIFDLLRIHYELNLIKTEGEQPPVAPFGGAFQGNNHVIFGFVDESIEKNQQEKYFEHIILANSKRDLVLYSNSLFIKHNEDIRVRRDATSSFFDFGNPPIELPENNSIETEYHIWKANQLALKNTQVVLYKTVTPKRDSTWVRVRPTDYIEDSETGKRYYVLASSLGYNRKYNIWDKHPLEFAEIYPPLPPEVKRINIHHDEGTYYIKDFKIRD